MRQRSAILFTVLAIAIALLLAIDIMIGSVGIAIGDVVLVSFPGEPFTDIGVQTKDTPGWKAILPCALTNGYQGYFPMRSAFDEGGYEARSSNYVAGVAETLIAGAKELLGDF